MYKFPYRSLVVGLCLSAALLAPKSKSHAQGQTLFPKAMYVQTFGNHKTSSSTFVDIPDMDLDLNGFPFGYSSTNPVLNFASLTLNVSRPYVVGGTHNGIEYRLVTTQQDGTDLVIATGAWTNLVNSNGRSPITLKGIVYGDLPPVRAKIPVRAQWRAVRGATANLGGDLAPGNPSATLLATFLTMVGDTSSARR